VDRRRPAGVASLRGADLLFEPEPQPDPNTHYEAFSRFVTSDFWVLKHLFASDIGLILAIFGPTIARRLTGYFAAPGGTKKRPRIRLSLT